MRKFNWSDPVVDGWHWRFVGLTVVAILFLQIVADYLLKYRVVTTVPLGVLFAAYVIIPRIKERRLGNALAGAIAVFIVDVILEIVLDYHGTQFAAANRSAFLQFNVYALLLGIAVCYGYLKLTQWSERKRDQMAERRRNEARPTGQAPRRHHSDKRKKRRK